MRSHTIFDYSSSIICCLHVEKMDVLGKFEDCKFRERKLGIISCPGIRTYHTFNKNQLYIVFWIGKCLTSLRQLETCKQLRCTAILAKGLVYHVNQQVNQRSQRTWAAQIQLTSSPLIHLPLVILYLYKRSWSFAVPLFITVCDMSIMTFSSISAFVSGLCYQEGCLPLPLAFRYVPFQQYKTRFACGDRPELQTQKSTHIFETTVKGLRGGI